MSPVKPAVGLPFYLCYILRFTIDEDASMFVVVAAAAEHVQSGTEDT